MTHFGRLLGGFIILAFMLGLFCVSAETAEAAGAWKWKGEAEAGLAYDTNVYSLSSTQKARLKEDRASDQTSGSGLPARRRAANSRGMRGGFSRSRASCGSLRNASFNLSRAFPNDTA